ncbi:NADH:ubiquinone reductase (Na(+)-transporting) subunit F [Zhongshania marina]|uniref:Phenol hydroxylase n=1 Tax=Zhongshania marina TaxID=2304603 RepID=A0A2S4HLC7_9GAMM|nr:phenol 2-monooxygenase domain-containing protein [Marortus luteolus]POP54491.1 phenol hydroxylase [Marortus luteolus]
MSYQLTIEPLGETIEVDEGQTILDAALRAGIYLPHACCHGLCATCKVQVIEGDIEHGDASPFALMDFERDEGKILACCATLESDISIEADIDEEPDAEIIPVQDYQGKVSKIESLTPTIIGVWIKLEKPIHFQAGQYINLNIPGSDITRPFSLANKPSENFEIELNIRIVPGGVGTTYIHERLKVGDQIGFSGPYGRFFVRKSNNKPIIFMAGGSGLSSPLSMILDLFENQFTQSITLVYGQRNKEELYYHSIFLDMADRYPNFNYVPALSDENSDSAWDGYRGFVHEAAQEYFKNNFSGHNAYLCGPPLMIDSCITTLMQGQLFEKDIYLEKFISAADAQKSTSPLFKKL